MSPFFESCFILPNSTGSAFFISEEHSQQWVMRACKLECTRVLFKGQPHWQAGRMEGENVCLWSYSFLRKWTVYSQVMIMVMLIYLSSAKEHTWQSKKKRKIKTVYLSHRWCYYRKTKTSVSPQDRYMLLFFLSVEYYVKFFFHIFGT